MASLVLGAVGSYLGGPIGYMIGSALGAALFPPPGQDGPRLSDLKVQNSVYGNSIPIIYGTFRAAGNVIWAAQLVEHANEQDSGSGGGGFTTYTYTCSFAVSLCEGPIAGIRRVWADGKLIYDITPGVTNNVLFKATSHKLYLGGETQLPDPTMEAGEGIGNVPAYRGQAYWVFADLELGKYGNRLPNLTFEVIASGTVLTGWLTDIAGAPPDRFNLGQVAFYNKEIWIDDPYQSIEIRDTDTGAFIQTLNVREMLGFPVPALNQDKIWTQAGDYIVDKRGRLWMGVAGGSYPAGTVPYLAVIDMATRTLVTTLFDSANGYSFYHYNRVADTMVFWKYGNPPTFRTIDAGTFTLTSTVTMPSGVDFFEVDNEDRRWVAFGNGDAKVYSATMSLLATLNPTVGVAYFGYLPSKDIMAVYDYNIPGSSDRITFYSTQSFGILGSYSLPDGYYMSFRPRYAPLTDEFLFVQFDPTGVSTLQALNMSDFTTTRQIYPPTGTPLTFHSPLEVVVDAAGDIYAYLERPDGYGSPYALTKLTGSVVVKPPHLSEIVSDISSRTSLTSNEIDVTQLIDVVDGFCIATPMSAQAAIEPLSHSYFFDSVDSEGRVRFVKRGATPVLTIAATESLLENK